MSYKDIPLYCVPRRRPTVPALIQCVEETIKTLRYTNADFICHAIPEGNTGNYLREYVSASLGRYPTLYGWRVANGRDKEPKATRKARFAWLNWMLKNLKEELADTHNRRAA